MEMHDVIVECERFSLDMTDRCSHDNCQLTNLAAAGFRSRSGTSNSTTTSAACRLEDLSRLERVSSSHLTDTNNGFFTPSRLFPVKTPPIIEASAPTPIPPHVGQTISAVFPSQEGTSPPEAAIEATPETTPIRVSTLAYCSTFCRTVTRLSTTLAGLSSNSRTESAVKFDCGSRPHQFQGTRRLVVAHDADALSAIVADAQRRGRFGLQFSRVAPQTGPGHAGGCAEAQSVDAGQIVLLRFV